MTCKSAVYFLEASVSAVNCVCCAERGATLGEVLAPLPLP